MGVCGERRMWGMLHYMQVIKRSQQASIHLSLITVAF